LWLAGSLLVLAIVIAIASRWRKRSASPVYEPGDQLAHFRSLYERGMMSQEEFDRVRGLLSAKLRQALDMPSKPAPPENPPEEGIRPA
jgi:hypothetical protein